MRSLFILKFFIRLCCNIFSDKLQGSYSNLKKLKFNQVMGYLLKTYF